MSYSYWNNTFNCPLGDWIRQEAVKRKVSPEELEKIIEITPIRIGDVTLWASYSTILKRYNEKANQFDAVTDFREGPIPRSFFIFGGYYMSGTGIKFNNKTS